MGNSSSQIIDECKAQRGGRLRVRDNKIKASAAAGLVDRVRTSIGSSLECIEVSACRLKACPDNIVTLQSLTKLSLRGNLLLELPAGNNACLFFERERTKFISRSVVFVY